MITLDDIQKIQQRADVEKWSYPYLFNSLKAAGVERYEVNVLTHETRFVGGGTSVIQPAPADFRPLTAGAYDLDALQAALARVQTRETTYAEFLAEIAAAGVSFYRVDMKPRKITYHGPKPYKYVETIPDTKS